MKERSETGLEAAERRALAFLDDADAARLRGYLHALTLKPGETLNREGEAMRRTAFLVEGRLAVKKETAFSGKYILLGLLESGAVAGEGVLAGRERHGATVEAMEECRLLILTGEDFARLADDHPRLAVQLLRRLLLVAGLRLGRAGERLVRLL